MRTIYWKFYTTYKPYAGSELKISGNFFLDHIYSFFFLLGNFELINIFNGKQNFKFWM